jgi:hypothetical protein
MPSGYVVTTEGIFPSDTLFPSNILYPESEIVIVPIVYPYDVGIYQDGMFPSETLFPSEDLYPIGNDLYIVPPRALVDVYSTARTMWNFQPPSYASYLNYLGGNIRKSYFKIELLRREDETVYDTLISDIVNADGSTSNQNQEGVRRTCSFSLINAINEYTMFFSNLSIGNKFRLYIGYEIGTKIRWFCHGTFLFDNPTMVSQFSDRTIQVVGSDKWTMLNGVHGGILDATFIAPLGSDIYGLVKTILNLNIVGDPMPPLIDSSLLNKATTYDITKQAGDTVADLLLEIAYNLSCYIYYSPEGRLVIRPFEYDTIKAAAFDLTVNDYNFLGMSKQLSFDKVYNAVQVRADNIQNADVPIIAEVLNNDLMDPNSYPNYGIKKLYVVTEYTKGIDTNELAQARANWELKNVKSRQSAITANTLPLYHLDVNDVVTITDQSTNDVKTRYLIVSIATPISTSGQVSLQIVRTTDEI